MKHLQLESSLDELVGANFAAIHRTKTGGRLSIGEKPADCHFQFKSNHTWAAISNCDGRFVSRFRRPRSRSHFAPPFMGKNSSCGIEKATRAGSEKRGAGSCGFSAVARTPDDLVVKRRSGWRRRPGQGLQTMRPQRVSNLRRRQKKKWSEGRRRGDHNRQVARSFTRPGDGHKNRRGFTALALLSE